MESMRKTAYAVRSPGYRRFAAALLGVLTLAAAQRALAGPVEQMVELSMMPGKSQAMVVRYANGGGGFFVSQDGGSSWKMQCHSAFLSGGGRVKAPTLLLRDGSMLMLSSDGVLHADANGCGLKAESPDVAKGVADMTQHPSDAQRVFGVVSNPMGMSGVIQRSADGKWSELGVKDAPSPLSLRVTARGDGLRFYELVVKSSAMTSDAGTIPPVYAIRVSDDEAKTWQEYPLAIESGSPRLRAVDPSNSERLLIVVERPTAADTVLVSRDGGKTTSKYLDIEEPGGIAFAPDGKVWIGDLGAASGAMSTRGLYAAANLDAMPTRLSMATYPVQCLGYAEDTNTLYACQRFWFGKVDQESGEFTTTLRFTQVPAFVSCDGQDTAAQCKAQLCLDYCGPAHFAVAPVCSAYDEPACGKPVAAAEADPASGAGGAAAGSGGSPAAAGGGPAAMAGSMSVAAGTGSAAGSGSKPEPVEKKGGCTALPGASGASAPAWLALGILGAAFGRRRRRRTGW
jgi:MYXO-CTERM domain-containing protein